MNAACALISLARYWKASASSTHSPQISGGKRGLIKLTPASELIFDDERIENFRTNYRELFGSVIGDDPLYEAISEGRHYAGMEHWLPLFYGDMETLFDYLPDIAISFDHLSTESRFERLAVVKDYYEARLEPTSKKLREAPISQFLRKNYI